MSYLATVLVTAHSQNNGLSQHYAIREFRVEVSVRAFVQLEKGEGGFYHGNGGRRSRGDGGQEN